MILAADIGGTNARVALFADGSEIVCETFRTEAWGSAEEILLEFLARHPARVDAVCVAVAGPVHGGRSAPMNIPWTVEELRLANALGVAAVSLVNDLEANARGIMLLGREDLAVLNHGDSSSGGNCVVVSAGTGLGEAGLLWDGRRYVTVAGEGGHADFAPRTDVEVALYRYLAADYGHVSYERVCSGGGLVNIYRFLRDGEGRQERSWIHGAGAAALPSPAAVAAEAANNPRSLGARALAMFVSIYGARAANVALSFMATGGVYLGGGIAPRITTNLAGGGFMKAFTAKGRVSQLLARIPVYVVLNDRAALLGAADIAADLVAAPQLGKVVALR